MCLNTRRGSKRDVVQLSDFKSDFKSEDDDPNDSDPDPEVTILNDPTLRNESTLEICSSYEDNIKAKFSCKESQDTKCNICHDAHLNSMNKQMNYITYPSVL